MTKIAFLISGRSRAYIYQAHTFYNNVFKYCDADIYISFKKNSKLIFNKNELDMIPNEYKINIDENIDDKTFLTNLFGDRLKYFDYDDENYIQTLINNKMNNLKNYDLNFIDIKFKLDQYARVKNIVEKFEKTKLENKLEYDIIVRTRLDQLFWVDTFNITKIISNNNKLYIGYPRGTDYLWISDFFMFGNCNLMIYLLKKIFDNMFNSVDFMKENVLNYAPEIQIAKIIESDKLLNENIIKIKLPIIFVQTFTLNFPLYLNAYYIGNNLDSVNSYINKMKLIINKNIK